MDSLNDPQQDKYPIRVLMITSEYPSAERPGGGVFIVRQIKALREAGVEVDVLDFISRANPLNHLRAWRKMKRMMATRQYDLIHAQFAVSAFISRLQFKLPVVVTYHGDETQGIIRPNGTYALKGRVLVLLSQIMALLVDEVIVVSQAMGKRLIRKDYHVIPSGIELEKFKPIPRAEARSKLGWPIGSRIALFAVLMINEPRKRYWLAKAAVDLACKILPVEIKVVTGVPPDDIPLYMNASDVLLLTSLHEGSPTVVKEALACNLPVVSVNVGDVEERLSGVSNCAVVDATPEAIAHALVEIVRAPVRSNGREAVLWLSEPLLAQKVIEVYQKALRKTPRSSE